MTVHRRNIRYMRRAMTVLMVAVWVFSGWPVIMQTPRIPPAVKTAFADETTYTFSFAADTESWTSTACGAPGATCQWQSGDGDPVNGSLEESETRKNKNGTWTWQLSGITWEDLGVPAGGTVMSVDGSYHHAMTSCTSCGSTNTSGDLVIRDSADTVDVATLETGVTYSGTTAWATRDVSGAMSIGATYEASNTGIILQLSGFLNTDNSNPAGATLRQDEISLTITYTAPANISVAVSDGVVSYGTLAPGASTSTILLTDTQEAGNNGDVAEDFNIIGSNSNCPWTLTALADPGTDEFIHEFSTNGGGSWTPLSSQSYQTLATSVSAGSSQSFDLRITVPSDTNCYDVQSVDVTVQAVQS